MAPKLWSSQAIHKNGRDLWMLNDSLSLHFPEMEFSIVQNNCYYLRDNEVVRKVNGKQISYEFVPKHPANVFDVSTKKNCAPETELFLRKVADAFSGKLEIAELPQMSIAIRHAESYLNVFEVKCPAGEALLYFIDSEPVMKQMEKDGMMPKRASPSHP